MAIHLADFRMVPLTDPGLISTELNGYFMRIFRINIHQGNMDPALLTDGSTGLTAGSD